MIKRTAMLVTLLAVMSVGFNSANVQAADKQMTACEKKAEKKKFSNDKKKASYIKKCEAKNKK